jgi:hypothetical protein
MKRECDAVATRVTISESQIKIVDSIALIWRFLMGIVGDCEGGDITRIPQHPKKIA